MKWIAIAEQSIIDDKKLRITHDKFILVHIGLNYNSVIDENDLCMSSGPS